MEQPNKFMGLKCVAAVFHEDGLPHVNHRGKTATAREYHYYVPNGDDPRVGDLILTSVNWGGDEIETEEDLTLAQVSAYVENARFARVVKVYPTPQEKAKKFYLKLLSRRELRGSHSRNMALLQRIQEAEEARARLEELLKEQDNTDRYTQLAKSNPEAAALLAKLNFGGKADD